MNSLDLSYTLFHLDGDLYRAPMGYSLHEGWVFIRFLPEVDEAGLPVWEIIRKESR